MSTKSRYTTVSRAKLWRALEALRPLDLSEGDRAVLARAEQRLSDLSEGRDPATAEQDLVDDPGLFLLLSGVHGRYAVRFWTGEPHLVPLRVALQPVNVALKVRSELS